jgi:NAD(P)-dependent dehydrogenase (short-subunit alcohol dehydrogenase family)
MAELDVSGRAALVTGAARGIGLETARALHARGASVGLVDLDSGEVGEAARSIGERAFPVAADVTDEAAVRLAVEATLTEFGRLDIVVANAGIAQPVRPVSVVDPKAFDGVLAVNLNGVVYTVRQALPHVIEQRGHVLVIASVYAFLNGALQSSYAMSKAAVEQLGRALRVELAPHGASAGVGYFGFVNTAMVQGAQEDPIAKRLERLAPPPFRKRITPVEAGEVLAGAVERRAARTVRPRRWGAYSRLRGLVNPGLDEAIARRRIVHESIAEAERRGRAER